MEPRDSHSDVLVEESFFGYRILRKARTENLIPIFRALLRRLSPDNVPAPREGADSRRFGCTLHSFFLREYVAGKTLFDVSPEIFDARKDEAKRIIRTLHGFGITHGDAHPGNFILDEASGRLKVIDVGGKMPTAIQKATDRMRMEKEWGIPNDVRDWGWALARLHVVRRHFLARLRKIFS